MRLLPNRDKNTIHITLTAPLDRAIEAERVLQIFVHMPRPVPLAIAEKDFDKVHYKIVQHKRMFTRYFHVCICVDLLEKTGTSNLQFSNTC